jgi:hypothetical protein
VEISGVKLFLELIFFAKERGGVVSNFVLPECDSNLLNPAKVNFIKRKGDQK